MPCREARNQPAQQTKAGEHGPDALAIQDSHILDRSTKIRIVRTQFTTSPLRVAAVLLAAAGMALAHYTWIAPAGASLEVGKPALVRLFHGHHFPVGEEKMQLAGSQVKAISPSGQVTDLTGQASPQGDSVNYLPKQAGLHRIVYTLDRGVMSRTPQGVKPGGRDKNPGAAQSFRRYVSSVAYLPVGGKGTAVAGPSGAEFELSATPQQGGGWVVTVLAQGKPVPGVAVEAFVAGAEAPVAVGKSDGNGAVRHTAAKTAAAPVLFTAEWKAPAPAGAAYDAVNYSTSLYLQP